jgi:hypothetical protein
MVVAAATIAGAMVAATTAGDTAGEFVLTWSWSCLHLELLAQSGACSTPKSKKNKASIVLHHSRRSLSGLLCIVT